MLIPCLLGIWIGLGSLAIWARSGARGAGLWLGASLIAVTQIVGQMLILGWLGAWQRTWVVGLGIGLNAVCVGLGWRELLRLLREVQIEWREHRLEYLRPRLVWGVVLLNLGIGAWTLWLGWLLPPTDWDGLAQHLPIAGLHLQAGDLARIETPYRGIHAYPASGSLLMAWIMLVGQTDTAVDLAQWPFWWLGTLGLYHLAHRLGANRSQALWGSAIFSLAPVVILQARSDYVDLILAGMVVAALALLADEQLPVENVLPVVGCALGVVVGLKYAGLIYGALLGGLAVWRLWDQARPWRSRLQTLALLSVCALAVGGFWYWRNGLELANPVWPITLNLGPLTLKGVWTTTSFYENALPDQLAGLSYPQQLWTVWREPTLAFAPDMRLGGLGPLWLAVGLPCLGLWIVRSLVQRQRWPLRLAGFAILAFLLTPANWHTRYIVIPAALSGLAVASVLGRLDRGPRILLNGLMLLLGAYGVALAIFFGPLTPTEIGRFTQLPAVERRPVFMDSGVAAQPAMRWLDRNVPETAALAYGWEGVVLYPFEGPNARRRAVYVPPTASPAWYLALKERQVMFLVVRPGSAEAQAAAVEPRFRPAYVDESYLIYALAP